MHLLLMVPALIALLLAFTSCAMYPRSDIRRPYYKAQPKHYRPWSVRAKNSEHDAHRQTVSIKTPALEEQCC
jgi:hypothetical protein